MTTIVQPGGIPQDFARAFGDKLNQHLRDRGIGPTAAATVLGLKDKNGKPNRALVDSYCHDKKDGTRPRPNAEMLYLACTKLEGFVFDYMGYRISAVVLKDARRKRRGRAPMQREFKFVRQFKLTDDSGGVNVRVKRPADRIEVSVSLNAKAS